MNFFERFSGVAKVITALVVIALAAALVVVFRADSTERHITVDFSRANSLYKGSDVRILGVPVGRVEELEARGNVVRATLSYEGDVRLPADVKAVIISPAIVGDRFVQLAPAYSGGAVLPNDAKLSVDRTEVPVELDEIFQSLDDLSVALGPDGANKEGSLSSLIEDSARQLDGQGRQLNETLTNFAKLSTTLSNNQDELFGSVREIEEFIGLLQRNDSSVRSFFDSTARVSRVLEAERDDLATTLEYLSKALIDVRTLVKDNRSTLRNNVDNLERLVGLLARHDEDIAETLHDAPVALGNLGLAGGSSETGTLDARTDLGKTFGGILANPQNLPQLFCSILGEQIPPGQQLCQSLADLLGGLLPKNLEDGLQNTNPEAEEQGGASPDLAGDLAGLLGVAP